MVKLDTHTRLNDMSYIVEQTDRHNKLVDTFEDALKWLTDTTKDKQDKKATQAVLDAYKTQYHTYRSKEGRVHENYKWCITMGDNPYSHIDEIAKRLSITLYELTTRYGETRPYWHTVDNFYAGEYSYPKGGTWADVLQATQQYYKPTHRTNDTQELNDIRDKFADIIDQLSKLGDRCHAYADKHGYNPTDYILQ